MIDRILFIIYNFLIVKKLDIIRSMMYRLSRTNARMKKPQNPAFHTQECIENKKEAKKKIDNER